MPRRFTMTPGLRRILDTIDVFLTTDPDARALWAVLTALRGPDLDYDGKLDILKSLTTACVRAAAFPRLHDKAKVGGNGAALGAYLTDPKKAMLPSGWEDPARDAKLGYPTYAGSHFWNHTTDAYEALDITPLTDEELV